MVTATRDINATARAPARASAAETAGVLGDVVMPVFARGVILRRPGVTALLDRADADRRAVRRLQLLRESHGDGPVMLSVPGREVAVVLSGEHVRQVLDRTPEPFATASREKVAALSHFQPHGVLISHGATRADRRRFNEGVLDSSQPVHGHARDLVTKVREEAGAMLEAGGLDWDAFARGWWRMVRRVVLGDAARDDETVTELLKRLRADANWAFLKPRRRHLRARFFAELQRHLDRAEPGSLASLVASTPAAPDTRPEQQVPQWLFAFDAAGMASFRALALLDAHPEEARRAREEIAAVDLSEPHDLPFLRACVLESVRLWPTTPAVLRETTAETPLDGVTLPRAAGVLIFAPFFHRDETRLPFADSFAPDVWLDETSAGRWPLVPFSAGPAECAGRNLVLLITSALLASLLSGRELRQAHPRPLDAARPLPATLSPFRLRFDLGG